MTESGLRIAMLCESFGALGGVAQIVEDLSAEFARAGHRVAIVSNLSGRDAITRLRNPAVEQVWIELPRQKPASWRHPERFFQGFRAVELINFMNRWHPHLLNVHGGLRDRFPPVVEACEETDVPLVQSIHLMPEGIPHYALAALRAARAITFPSCTVKQAFEELSSDARRARVIRGGVNIAALAEARPYQHPRPYMFCASRLDLRHKAVDLLVRAFSLIAGEFPQLDLLVAGDGPDRERVAEIIRAEGLGARIQMLLTRPHEELWGLYKGATAFIMLSRKGEGLPLVFFEAMAAGVAVIATRIGGTPELVIDGATGLLAEPESAESATAAIRQLLINAAMRGRLARNGYELVIRRYTWRAAAEQLLEIYQECRR
jgi:glycosyltransferase involved in cell wall biosynthesis